MKQKQTLDQKPSFFFSFHSLGKTTFYIEQKVPIYRWPKEVYGEAFKAIQKV